MGISMGAMSISGRWGVGWVEMYCLSTSVQSGPVRQSLVFDSVAVWFGSPVENGYQQFQSSDRNQGSNNNLVEGGGYGVEEVVGMIFLRLIGARAFSFSSPQPSQVSVWFGSAFVVLRWF